MSRLVLAGLTAALAVYSYFDIETGLPLLTAQVMTHRGTVVPVSRVLSSGLHITWWLQIIAAALLLGAPYIALQTPRFVSWCLGRYSPAQWEPLLRILPLVKEMTGILALLDSSYLASRIHLEIHDARAHGPLLPADWLMSVDRMELKWLLVLMVMWGIVIYLYIAKIEDAANEE